MFSPRSDWGLASPHLSPILPVSCIIQIGSWGNFPQATKRNPSLNPQGPTALQGELSPQVNLGGCWEQLLHHLTTLLRPDRSLQQNLLQQQNCGQQMTGRLITAAPALPRQAVPTPLSAVNQTMCGGPPPPASVTSRRAPRRHSDAASWGNLPRAPSPSIACQGPPRVHTQRHATHWAFR